MGQVEQIEFRERDGQWYVTMTVAGRAVPGEPFPASGHERFSKLNQVLYRLEKLGLQPTHIPYSQPDKTWYAFKIKTS